MVHVKHLTCLTQRQYSINTTSVTTVNNKTNGSVVRIADNTEADRHH